MSNAIKISNLSETINKELNIYSSEITERIKDVAKEITEELVKNTRNDAPKRTGKFKKHISMKKTQETSRSVIFTWFVKDPEYRLSHLIAKGHKLKNGKESKKNDFIEKNEKIAIEKYEKNVKEVIGG